MENSSYNRGESSINGRVIMHVDLDAFFASCEEKRNPKLKGLPVIIGADPKNGHGRGVVSTANYIARKYHIKSAMPITWAYKRCKYGIFLPVDYPYYSEVSKRVMKILRDKCERFEQGGIDEAYLDLSHLTFNEAEELGEQLKSEVKQKEKITCSVGIGPNKLIAKIASDHKKPDGLTLVRNTKVLPFISRLKVEKLPGIGKKTGKHLHELGIMKVTDLEDFDLGKLEREFGRNHALYLKNISYGIDDITVSEERETKSIGRMKTFEKDISEQKIILKELDSLIEEVHEYLDKTLSFKTLTIRVRYSNFETHDRQRSLKTLYDLNEIKHISHTIIKPYINGDKIRLIGVTFSNFKEKSKEKQLLLQ